MRGYVITIVTAIHPEGNKNVYQNFREIYPVVIKTFHTKPHGPAGGKIRNVCTTFYGNPSNRCWDISLDQSGELMDRPALLLLAWRKPTYLYIYVGLKQQIHLTFKWTSGEVWLFSIPEDKRKEKKSPDDTQQRFQNRYDGEGKAVPKTSSSSCRHLFSDPENHGRRVSYHFSVEQSGRNPSQTRISPVTSHQ